MIIVLMGFGAGMARLRSAEIYFTVFCVSSPNEREGIVGFGFEKRDRMSMIY